MGGKWIHPATFGFEKMNCEYNATNPPNLNNHLWFQYFVGGKTNIALVTSVETWNYNDPGSFDLNLKWNGYRNANTSKLLSTELV